MQSYIKCRLLTAAVHRMTSLQASFPDFRRKSSPKLLSSQSFASCDLVLSSSWQITTGSIQECESWLSLKLGWGNNRRLLVQLSSVLLFSESDCWKSEGQCEKKLSHKETVKGGDTAKENPEGALTLPFRAVLPLKALSWGDTYSTLSKEYSTVAQTTKFMRLSGKWS